jgi:hypothetical protein
MHINAANNLPPLAERIRKASGSRADIRDAATFPDTQALKGRLNQTAEVRPEAVARGRELVNSSSYPPDHTVRGIAALLAAQLSGNEQE